MDTRKRSAFTATPRGGKAKSGGNTTRKEKKEERTSVVINRSFIEQYQAGVKMDDQLKDVLRKADASININVDFDDRKKISVVASNGLTIGDEADIAQATGLGAFIASSRKELAKSATAANNKKTLWALKTVVSQDTALGSQKVPETINKGIIDVIRPIQAALKNITANVEVMNDFLKDEDADAFDRNVAEYLRTSCARARNALGEFVIEKFTNYESDKKTADFLRARMVPGYVFKRISEQKIATKQKDFTLSSVLFPTDPSKGFFLSFEEVRDAAFLYAQGPVLAGMNLSHAFFSNNEIVELFLGESITEEDGKIKSSLSGAPIAVAPPFSFKERILDLAAKQGQRGYGWADGTSDSLQDRLKFMGNLFKKASYLAFSKTAFVAPLLEKVFCGYIYDASKKDSGVFPQLVEAIRKDAAVGATWAYLFKPADENFVAVKRKKLVSLICQIMEIPASAHTLTGALFKFFGLEENPETKELKALEVSWATPVTGGGSALSQIDGKDYFSQLNAAVDACSLDSSEVNRFIAQVFGDDEKKSGKGSRTAIGVRSKLHPFTIRVLRTIVQTGRSSLAAKLQDWFRKFSTEAIQAAVALVLEVKFEAFMAESVDFTEEFARIFGGPTHFGSTSAAVEPLLEEEDTEESLAKLMNSTVDTGDD